MAVSAILILENKLKQGYLPTEYDEQCALVEYLQRLEDDHKIIKFTALPNNLWTKSWQQKRKQTAEGLRSGFPDMCVVTTKKVVFIEMKRRKNGTLSPEQKAWIAAFGSINVNAVVCKGYHEAKEYIDKHL